ncbi:MAG TPA: HlyD family efflux transporter periplasmic adaptor subunit [Xanthomonadaceae bacterium]|nr:HlyD family efflux transporter periplasmic adaptor subunit [Xanthomonadaceae bacterium]
MMRPFLLLAGTLALAACGGGDGRWVDAAHGDVPVTVRVTGSLESANTARLSPPPVTNIWNYTIAQLVPEGTEVRAGMPVVRFDASQLREQLQTAEAQLNEKRQELAQRRQQNAQTGEERTLETAQRSMEAERALRKAEQPEDLVAGIEYSKLVIDRELTAYRDSRQAEKVGLARAVNINAEAAIEAEVERLELDVARIRNEMERMNLRAPRDGVMIVHSDWSGEKFTQNSRIWAGQTVGEIPDLTQMVAKVQVAERLAGELRVGQPARVQLDADPDRVFRGEVVRINPALRQRSRDSAAMVVDAEIAIADPDPDFMRPGMSLKAEVVTATLPAALRVPVRAVEIAGDGAFVRVRGAMGEQRRSVRLGARVGEEFVVEDGLSAGDRVWMR